MLTMLSRCRQSVAVLLLLALIACTGCSESIDFGRSTSTVELSIRQAKATGQPGVYLVSGSTTLPEQTRITLTAVRDFRSPDAPVYAILDRQFATVEQGNWQASLNLWQAAPDGRLQENWQLSGLSAPADPALTVTFLATLDPANQPAGLKDQIEAQDDATQATLVRFTTDGELYLEASKRVTVSLPSGSIAAPAPTPTVAPRTSDRPPDAPAEGDRQGWSQTTAPLSPTQLLR